MMFGAHYRQCLVCIIHLQISRRSSSALYIFTFVPQLGGWWTVWRRSAAIPPLLVLSCSYRLCLQAPWAETIWDRLSGQPGAHLINCGDFRKPRMLLQISSAPQEKGHLFWDPRFLISRDAICTTICNLTNQYIINTSMVSIFELYHICWMYSISDI